MTPEERDELILYMSCPCPRCVLERRQAWSRQAKRSARNADTTVDRNLVEGLMALAYEEPE